MNLSIHYQHILLINYNSAQTVKMARLREKTSSLSFAIIKNMFWLPILFYDGRNCLCLLHSPFSKLLFMDAWCYPTECSHLIINLKISYIYFLYISDNRFFSKLKYIDWNTLLIFFNFNTINKNLNSYKIEFDLIYYVQAISESLLYSD